MGGLSVRCELGMKPMRNLGVGGLGATAGSWPGGSLASCAGHCGKQGSRKLSLGYDAYEALLA